MPEGLIAELLTRFSSSSGYKLYPDVIPFFQTLRRAKQDDSSDESTIGVGILTNSDDRVPQILSSFGLLVGPWRYGTPPTRQQNPSESLHDIDFVALSYDIGFAKPDSRAFDAAKSMAQDLLGKEVECTHVGDDEEKDYHAALAAGWRSVLLDREGVYIQLGTDRVSSLTELSDRFVAT